MSTILVVDDMAVFREPIAAALGMHGYKTISAANGVQALAICRSAPPDLIVLDLGMPEMDGLEFLKAWGAEQQENRIPVIVLSVVSERDQVVQAARLGARDFILKSQFSLNELLMRVEKCLAPKAATAESSAAGSGAEQPTESANAPPAAAPIAPAVAAPGASSPAVAPTVVLDEASLDPEMPASLRAMKPILTRSQIRERLDNCGELKAMSPAVAQILALCRSASCSIDQIARALKQDHALALTMLKIANSAIYTRGEPVESVHKAVTRIGVAQTRQIVTNISVVECFSKGGPAGRISAPLFWEHSIACGLTCAQIARGLDASTDDVDSAFTMGLLHDVGRMVYADMLGDTYTQVLDVAAQLQLPLELVESRMLLVNHADAMDRVLHAWHFPKNLIDPIAFHHLSAGNIRRISPRMLRVSCMLALADRLAHAMLIGDSGNPTLYPTAEFVQALALPARVMEQIEETVPDQTADLKIAMMSRSEQADWQPMAGQLTKQLKRPARPVFVGCDPAFDPFRIVCGRLGDCSPDQPANVVVVHISHMRERVTLGNRLREVESSRGVAGLPLVILSVNGQLRLEESAMTGRRAVLLPSTVTIHRLMESFNELTATASSDARQVA